MVKHSLLFKFLVVLGLGLAWGSLAVADDTPKVIWYGTLKGGLAEAKRSNRPIMLLSAAPHCHAVSGVW